QLLAAEEALAAGDGEGHHHPVSHLQVGHAVTDFLDDAHELVAEHHRPGLKNATGIDVQVRPADGGGGHLENNVAIVLDDRIGHRVVRDEAWSANHSSSHVSTSCTGRKGNPFFILR